jgi:arylsulfatase A-like enzyme
LGGRRLTPGLPPTEKTIATALKELGYRTALLGKWHLGSSPETHPNSHGFDEFFGFLAGAVDYYSHIYYWEERHGRNAVHDLWHNRNEAWYNGEYLTGLITKKAVEFIEGSDQPFLLYLPYNAPHWPMHAPKEYIDRFRGQPYDRRIMAAMIAALDDGVGAIVEVLQKGGKAENTLIFFSSDNGPSTEQRNWLDGREDLYYGGSAGLFKGHKYSLFEGGIREPTILAYPGVVAPGQVCDKPGFMLDVFPTLLTLAGGVPQNVDGVNILPVLTEGAASPHDSLFWEYNGQLAVREGKWKLVLNGKLDFMRSADDAVYLCDIENDPSERLNRKDEYPELVARLRQKVEAWYSEVSPSTEPLPQSPPNNRG